MNFLWLWLQTFVLIILSSAKSQNHFSTQFLTRKNPIHYTALIPLILLNKLNRLSSLCLHPIFFPALGSFLLLFSAPISVHQHPVTSMGISTSVLPDLLSPVFSADVDTIPFPCPYRQEPSLNQDLNISSTFFPSVWDKCAVPLEVALPELKLLPVLDCFSEGSPGPFNSLKN